MASGDLISGRVLVTGATGGLGQAIARAFAARGATLTLTGRRTDVLKPLAEELGARAVACDLADRDEVERLIGEMGEIDVLATNAGVPAIGALTDLTRPQIDNLLEVNLRAQIALAQAAAQGMIARRRGHIVLMSSLAAKTTAPATSIYSTTKFALRGFGLGIREDLRPYGVGVSVVMPGFISDAGMLVDAGIELPGYRHQDVARRGGGCAAWDRAQPRRGRGRAAEDASRLGVRKPRPRARRVR